MLSHFISHMLRTFAAHLTAYTTSYARCCIQHCRASCTCHLRSLRSLDDAAARVCRIMLIDKCGACCSDAAPMQALQHTLPCGVCIICHDIRHATAHDSLPPVTADRRLHVLSLVLNMAAPLTRLDLAPWQDGQAADGNAKTWAGDTDSAQGCWRCRGRDLEPIKRNMA